MHLSLLYCILHTVRYSPSALYIIIITSASLSCRPLRLIFHFARPFSPLQPKKPRATSSLRRPESSASLSLPFHRPHLHPFILGNTNIWISSSSSLSLSSSPPLSPSPTASRPCPRSRVSGYPPHLHHPLPPPPTRSLPEKSRSKPRIMASQDAQPPTGPIGRWNQLTISPPRLMRKFRRVRI